MGTIQKPVALIGAAQGWGARRSGTQDGPEALRRGGLVARLGAAGIPARWETTLATARSARHQAKTPETTLPIVAAFSERLAEVTRASLRHGRLPVVIGGDHSIAIGTWSGVTAELNARGRFGLLWFDAHMDAHTPLTRHEGKWGGHYHGQPLAVLLGHGEPELTGIAGATPKLDPRHVALIGIRSFEPGEDAFLKKLGVRVYHMDEIRARGYDVVFTEALGIVANGTAGFGLSLDMDGFDGALVPGVGTPEDGGLRRREVLPALCGLAHHPKFRAMEITEFNPHRDDAGRTAELAGQILALCLRPSFLP